MPHCPSPLRSAFRLAAWTLCCWAVLSSQTLAASLPPHTFTNPLFNGGDPWVVLEDGVYYYSASNCEGPQSICLKASDTLTGLTTAPWKTVWTPKAPSDPNGDEVWAPEIHKLNGHWYIYYAADPNHDNNLHRIFVLRANTDDPLGSYSESDTGAPHGALPRVNDHWGIDPNIFTAVDGALYLTWSCTNYADSRFPQRLCIIRMKDPEHPDGNPVPISVPLLPWEIRGAAIQEGPVGYVRNGRNYITYSASASYIANDYAVGVLENDGNDLLTPENWSKTGPIFDHHGTTYGPGSVVFIPSHDGKQFWNVYHAIDRLDCQPAYVCRDIRMQPMTFSQTGTPILGFPYNPGVPVEDPSAENGVSVPQPEVVNPGWGRAWGDTAEGSPAGAVIGDWSGKTPASITLSIPGPPQPPASAQQDSQVTASWNQIFLLTNPNIANFTATIEAKLVRSLDAPAFGMYCLYDDANNHAEVVVDVRKHSLSTHAVVNGAEQPWKDTPLPPAFDVNAVHQIECTKFADSFTVWLDRLSGAGVLAGRHFELGSGQVGLLARNAEVAYQNVAIK